jgi:hypothetical protein
LLTSEPFRAKRADKRRPYWPERATIFAPID